ncbi:MAG TPA: OmpA family protein [Methylomirabilota bacterium]|jgi:peptidoglycan-associated lipoprotein|nr:OmpA family protein [Methylomirabilota bacterium]
MKQTQLIPLLLLGLLLSAGCKTKNYGITRLPPPGTGGQSGTPMIADADKAPPAEAVKGTDDGTGFTPLNARGSHSGWKENNEFFDAYTVHFEYDSSILKSSELANIQAVAGQLKSNPSIAIKIRGHCDERGTEEYNRSLGERRALALREELIRLGIDPARLDTVSFGEDKPVAVSHNEIAWKQNRRGEFVELTPP